MARYAKLKIRIDVEHGAINPLEHRCDIAFATPDSNLPESSSVQRRMFSLERGVFAAPELLRQHGEPSTPQELARLPLLSCSYDREWTFTSADGTAQSVPTPAARLNSSNANIRLQAAVAGLGVLRITATYCQANVLAGLLRRLLPDYTCAPLRVYALLPSKRLMSAKVRIFLDALEQHASGIGPR